MLRLIAMYHSLNSCNDCAVGELILINPSSSHLDITIDRHPGCNCLHKSIDGVVLLLTSLSDILVEGKNYIISQPIMTSKSVIDTVSDKPQITVEGVDHLLPNGCVEEICK